MPVTDVVTIRKSMNKSGNSDKVYPVKTLAIPAQFARDIPDKQKYRCLPADDGVLVFEPVKEENE
jgi:hypothetical protein